ncbi:polyamine ABC transporter substrate-binding protein [Prosthecomicrobium sp. N25]
MALSLLGLAGALGLLAPAASQAQQRQVNIYNWSDYIDESILEDFTKETGIKVKYDTFDSNDLLETKLLAGKSGYDIVVPTATFLSRQIKVGLFQPLDKSKLPNLVNTWPDIMNRLAKYDAGNEHAINYMWGTTGIGYNVKKIKERMPDAPVDSLAMIFDPAIVSKFKDCGVMMLDASDEMIPAAMKYLGIDPDSKNPEDFKKAAEHFKKIRPNIRKFHSSEYINALANGDICLVLGWSGDIKQASTRAEERNKKLKDLSKAVEIAYAIPKEGAYMWFDNMAIPKDAKNVEEAHIFLNYMLRPEVAAKATNFVQYPNGNLASQKFVNKEILEDPSIYPTPDVLAKLYTLTANDTKTQRELTNTWRDMKRK